LRFVTREITFYKNHFMDFYLEQSGKVQEKIEYVLTMVRTVDRVPEKFLKHLTGTDGLYEIRVEYGSNIYRIFCFFDEGQLVILLNGFQKKTQKTPAKEIDKAERLKKEYLEDKKNGKV
jgi:phage-related protein